MPTSEWKAATQLRHRGHRHAPRDYGADSAANGHSDDNQEPRHRVGGRMRGERGGDCDRHADHAEKITPPAGGRMREAAQRQDEEGLRRPDRPARRDRRSCHFCFLWNMDSMRWVTRKPPKILTDANTSATKPTAAPRSNRTRPRRAGPRPPAARPPRSPRRSRWSPTSAAYAAPASPTRRPGAEQDHQRENRQTEHEWIDGVAGRFRCARTRAVARRSSCPRTESSHHHGASGSIPLPVCGELTTPRSSA